MPIDGIQRESAVPLLVCSNHHSPPPSTLLPILGPTLLSISVMLVQSTLTLLIASVSTVMAAAFDRPSSDAASVDGVAVTDVFAPGDLNKRAVIDHNKM